MSDERRSEPRTDLAANVVLTPLNDVSRRLKGSSVNISKRGIRVRLTPGDHVPIQKQVFRIETSSDRILCEVRNWAAEATSIEIGLEIL